MKQQFIKEFGERPIKPLNEKDLDGYFETQQLIWDAQFSAYEFALAQKNESEAVVIDSICAGIYSDGKRKEIPFGTKLYTSPPKQVIPDWISEPDTIPEHIINEARNAICKEFGNNGTDGYYKRILARIFKAMLSASPLPPKKVIPDGWIDVRKNKIPKNVKVDLYANGIRYTDCYYDSICDEWRMINEAYHLITIERKDITHWMPSPLPPNKGE